MLTNMVSFVTLISTCPQDQLVTGEVYYPSTKTAGNPTVQRFRGDDKRVLYPKQI
jgi:hypothetical protein